LPHAHLTIKTGCRCTQRAFLTEESPLRVPLLRYLGVLRMSRISSAPGASCRLWLVLLIFALHPMQAEGVDYVYARAILLCTLFSLMALDAWTLGLNPC